MRRRVCDLTQKLPGSSATSRPGPYAFEGGISGSILRTISRVGSNPWEEFRRHLTLFLQSHQMTSNTIRMVGNLHHHRPFGQSSGKRSSMSRRL